MAEEEKGAVIKIRGVEVDPPEEVVKGLEEFKPGTRVISAEEWADRWHRHAKAAAKDYAEGVKRPKRDPIKAAREAADKWKDKMKKVIDEGIWEKKMEKLDFKDWALGVLLTGITRYGEGVEKRKIKAEAVYKEIRDLVEYLAKTLDEMPVGTPEEREAKMVAAKRGMEIIGAYRKGILTLEEARSKISALKGLKITV